MLLYAISRWPTAVTINLWPYALRNAADASNMVPDELDGSSKLERFVSIKVSPSIKNFHTFGCPVYVLHEELESGEGITALSQ